MVDDGDGDAVHLRHQVGVEHIGWSAVGGDTTMVQEDEAIGERGGEVEVVDDRHDRSPRVRELGCDRHHVFLVVEVERSGRLVEQDDRGVLNEDASERHASLFSPGQDPERAVGEMVDVGGTHRLGHRFRVTITVRSSAHLDDLATGETERHPVLLREH